MLSRMETSFRRLLAPFALFVLLSPVGHLEAEGPMFSPELRQLLVLEMREIEDATRYLVPAVARGEWERVAELGDGIEGSFVLKRSLTPELRAEIGQLPEAFRSLDRTFHGTGGELADAARARDAEAVLRSLDRLVVSCVECHSAFALGRFPGLAPEPSEGER